MSQLAVYGIAIAFGFVAWGLVTAHYIWPVIRGRSSADALRPLIPVGMTMAEMAMRFILSEPTVATVIPGMRSLKNVEANMATSDAGPLSAALLKQLAGHRWVRQPTEWSQ